jgi:hypothetical protein
MMRRDTIIEWLMIYGMAICCLFLTYLFAWGIRNMFPWH